MNLHVWRRRRKVLNVTIIAFGAKAVRDFCLVICRIIAHKITYVPITLYFETDSNPLKFCPIICRIIIWQRLKITQVPITLYLCEIICYYLLGTQI